MNIVLQDERLNRRNYETPSCRVKSMESELVFLASNTEPIDDGGEQGWD